MKVLWFLTFTLLFLNNTIAQVSVSGGMGIMNGFATQRTSYGFNLGVEIPKSSDLTFYIRASAFLPKVEADTNYANMTALSQTTFPSTLTVPYTQRSSTFLIEGGTRSYMINDYDNGFALYGGSVFGVGVNTTSAKFSKKDYTNQYQWEGLYSLPAGTNTKGSIYFLGIGVQGGMKYTIPVRGTIFLDFTGIYSILNVANNDAGAQSMTYAKMNFLVQFGYRRDFY